MKTITINSAIGGTDTHESGLVKRVGEYYEHNEHIG